MAQLKKQIINTLIFAFLLTGIFTTLTFAQGESKVNQPIRLRPNSKIAPDELLDESLPDQPIFAPKEAIKTGSESFLKNNGTANSAAVGDLDTLFAPNISSYPGSVRVVAFQTDGKMLVGGLFKRINSQDHSNLARFNANGTIDSSFSPKIGDIVSAIVVQPDGKILICGNFTRVNDIGRNRIARLNTDGSLDTTFNPGGGTDNALYTMSLQPDGKIIIGGFFTRYNGETRNNIARLNADGSFDSGFNLLLENTGFVFNTYLQPDGKVLVGGFYSLSGDSNLSTILRFNSNGTLDTTFNFGGASANSTVRDIKQQTDGKFLIAGNFTTYNGSARGRVARLNADGSLDSTFLSSTAGANSTVSSLNLATSGKIIIGGSFTAYDGVARGSVAQLNSNGTLDTAFNPGTGFNGAVFETALLTSNQIFVGGNITQYNGYSSDIAVRLNSDATPDTSFALSAAASPYIRASVTQPDGKIVVGGSFNIANGVNHNSIVRFNSDGTLDTTFNGGSGTNSLIYAMALQPDGKILIGGNFTTYNGTTRNRIARINPNGTLDTSFAADSNSSIVNLTVLGDGKILVGGGFSTINGVARTGLVRLNADGTLDSSFVFNSDTAFVEGIGVQTDGKIVVGGMFRQVDSTPRESLARLNSNGSLDTSFVPPTLPNTGIFSLALQPDGKVLIGGNFFIFGASLQRNITRLNSDGSLDSSFLIGTGASDGDDIEDIAVQSNGKIIISGSINSINGVARSNIARLNSNGTLDNSFSPNVDNLVWDLNLDQNNSQRIIIGGDFDQVGGVQRTGLARLILDSPFSRTPFDFDGDGKTDISIFRPSASEWWYSRSSDGQVPAVQFGTSSDRLVPADYTGDGKTDIAFWRPSTGEWFVLRSEDGSYFSFPFGTAGDVPAVGDFDADGKVDIGVFRPSSATWYIIKSSGGTIITTFGQTGDVPVVGDYDGDGKTDIAIFRANGAAGAEWWYSRSSDGQVGVTTFGAGTDRPVQGDYTGDGKTDIAFWRPSTGEWFILRSENNSFFSYPFGASGDIPTPGDYDGDGRFDTAVFRPSGATWFINRTTAGILITTFGTAGDKPIPNIYVP